jgi:CrcB protein
MTMILAGVAGSIGAASRYAVTGLIQRHIDTEVPLGTAVVNLVGAFFTGLVAGLSPSSITGVAVLYFLGGFTTFSTWMIETVWAVTPGATWRPALNLVGSLLAGVALASLGYRMAG